MPFFALFPSWEDIINGLKSAFAGLFDWLKTKENWLGSFVPGWHDISGRASDIPGNLRASPMAAAAAGMGGSPVHRAAYGGGRACGSKVAAGDVSNAGGTIADQIREYGGADAGALMAIARSEGGIGNIYDKSGDHGTSFGPFQVPHSGGRGSQADILAARGINVRDPSTLQAQIAYMRQYGRIHGGWGANVWHGIHDKYHVPSIRSHPDDNAGAHRQSYAPPPRSNTTVVVHSRVNLDGRVLASGVERHIVKKHRFASGPADHDGRAGLPHVNSRHRTWVKLMTILYALRNFAIAAWRRALFRLTRPAHSRRKKHREREGGDKQHGGHEPDNHPHGHAQPIGAAGAH